MDVGSTVHVADIATDTGVVDGVPVRTLSDTGTVVEMSDHPPGSDGSGDPSPHVLVRLARENGDPVDVWVCAPRVSED